MYFFYSTITPAKTEKCRPIGWDRGRNKLQKSRLTREV